MGGDQAEEEPHLELTPSFELVVPKRKLQTNRKKGQLGVSTAASKPPDLISIVFIPELCAMFSGRYAQRRLQTARNPKVPAALGVPNLGCAAYVFLVHLRSPDVCRGEVLVTATPHTRPLLGSMHTRRTHAKDAELTFSHPPFPPRLQSPSNYPPTHMTARHAVSLYLRSLHLAFAERTAL